MNLTITADEKIVRKARIRALNENTSVNAVLGAFLKEYAGQAEKQGDALRRFAARSASRTGADGGGRGWAREDIYQDRLSRLWWPAAVSGHRCP